MISAPSTCYLKDYHYQKGIRAYDEDGSQGRVENREPPAKRGESMCTSRSHSSKMSVLFLHNILSRFNYLIIYGTVKKGVFQAIYLLQRTF